MRIVKSDTVSVKFEIPNEMVLHLTELGVCELDELEEWQAKGRANQGIVTYLEQSYR